VAGATIPGHPRVVEACRRPGHRGMTIGANIAGWGMSGGLAGCHPPVMTRHAVL
jgi:hypothetical protein